MRILIIEDNPTTVDYLVKGLKENLFMPDFAYNGQEGLFKAEHYEYDAIVLDIMLPGLNGWDIVQQIRSNNLHTPIIFLTAKDAIEDRVKGLELGADDYLVKPFAFSELLARLRSLLRRTQPQQTGLLQVVDLTMDIAKHKVTRGNKTLNLSAKEFMLLHLFVGRIGEVLSRTLIAEQVWDINFDSDTNVIDVAIKRLRDKIDKEFEVKLLHSVRGVGYVFEAR